MPPTVTGALRKRRSVENKLLPCPMPPIKRFRRAAMSIGCLPVEVLEQLVQYLNVTTLQHLAATSHFFQQLLTRQIILRLEFPFSQEFITEISSTNLIQKKPVLRLSCEDVIRIFPASHFKAKTLPTGLSYLLASQLALLDLSRLREVIFASGHVFHNTNSCSCRRCKMEVAGVANFDIVMLQLIKDRGLGLQLSYLQVLVDDLPPDFLSSFPNLQHLSLVASTPKSLAKLRSLVRKVRARHLELRILCRLGKKQGLRILSNKFVRRLRVTGPCSLQLQVVMRNLQEVEVVPVDAREFEVGQDWQQGQVCSYSARGERWQHRLGQCCVDVRTVLEGHCPQIQTFFGLPMRNSVGSLKSKQQVKRMFHREYMKQGGKETFGMWAKTRWNNRKLDLVANVTNFMQRSIVQIQNLANFYNNGANVPMHQIIQLVA